MSLLRRFLCCRSRSCGTARGLHYSAGTGKSRCSKPDPPPGSRGRAPGTGPAESRVVHRIQSAPQDARLFVSRTSGGGSASVYTMQSGVTSGTGRSGSGAAREGASGKSREKIGSALIWIVTGYKRLISPLLPSACRFYPTCSDYMREAIAVHGPAHGVWLGMKRLARCHPFHAGGFDAVPHNAPPQ